MEAVVERCCGLDVHQATVVACVLAGPPGRKPRKEVRTFGTMTRELEALRGWLAAEGVTHVAMESTGVRGGRDARRDGEHQGLLEAGLRDPRGSL